MTLAPFAEIEARIAAVTSARLANVVVNLDNGVSFAAERDVLDVDPIMAPSIIGDVQITYPSSAVTLQAGETVTIDGTQYRVAGDPERRGFMLTAQLREVTA